MAICNSKQDYHLVRVVCVIITSGIAVKDVSDSCKESRSYSRSLMVDSVSDLDVTGITMARTGSGLEDIQDIIHVPSYIYCTCNQRIYTGIQRRFRGTIGLVVCVTRDNTFTQN